jgi:hypothetical protein
MRILFELFIDSGDLFNFNFNNFFTPGDLIGRGRFNFFIDIELSSPLRLFSFICSLFNV